MKSIVQSSFLVMSSFTRRWIVLPSATFSEHILVFGTHSSLVKHWFWLVPCDGLQLLKSHSYKCFGTTACTDDARSFRHLRVFAVFRFSAKSTTVGREMQKSRDCLWNDSHKFVFALLLCLSPPTRMGELGRVYQEGVRYTRSAEAFTSSL